MQRYEAINVLLLHDIIKRLVAKTLLNILNIPRYFLSRFDVEQIHLLYSLCFSPTAIGGALSRDQKLSDYIHWK